MSSYMSYKTMSLFTNIQSRAVSYSNDCYRSRYQLEIESNYNYKTAKFMKLKFKLNLLRIITGVDPITNRTMKFEELSAIVDNFDRYDWKYFNEWAQHEIRCVNHYLHTSKYRELTDDEKDCLVQRWKYNSDHMLDIVDKDEYIFSISSDERNYWRFR